MEKQRVKKYDDDSNDDEFTTIFPQRLIKLLDDPSNHDAIIWLPNGKSFLIIDRQKFSTKVLPKYFRKTKYTSFTRKLNRWNFSRVTSGPDLGAYYHEFFQRGNEALCIQMYCKNNRFKYATSQGDATSIDTKNVTSEKKYQQSSLSNFSSQSLLEDKVKAQKLPLVRTLPLINYSTLVSNYLAPPATTIDPIIRIQALIAKQQAQIRQEQLKLSLTNGTFLPSQAKVKLVTTKEERMSEKVKLIEIQLKAIQSRMKQDQIQIQRPEKRNLMRKTSASAA